MSALTDEQLAQIDQLAARAVERTPPLPESVKARISQILSPRRGGDAT